MQRTLSSMCCQARRKPFKDISADDVTFTFTTVHTLHNNIIPSLHLPIPNSFRQTGISETTKHKVLYVLG